MSRKRNINQITEEPKDVILKRLKKEESSDDDYVEEIEDDSVSSLSDSITALSLTDSEEEDDTTVIDMAEDYLVVLEEEVQDETFLTPLKSELLSLCQHMEEKKVTLSKILTSELTTFEKERALELYGILMNTDANTFEYIELHQMLQNMIEGPLHQACTMDTKLKLSLLEDKLRTENPTLDKIVNANISESDKMMATQLYYMFYNETQYSYEWFSLRKKINTILDKPVDMSQYLELEKQEKLIKQFEQQETQLKNKILMLDADMNIKKKLFTMYESMMHDDDHDKIKNKLNWLIQLPYRKIVKPTLTDDYLVSIYKQLNTKMYGMYEIKEKLMLHINNKLNGNGRGHILALKSSPGVGKTRLVEVLAEAVQQPYAKLSFGGAVDSTLLVGHDQGWSGSSPGMIMQILARTKYANTIILLDEIDKLSSTPKGKEVQAALLHVLDPTQSTSFNDAYLNEFPHDISQVWFIATMNSDAGLDPALKDRLEIIELPSYNKEEMVQIMIKHTLPEACIKCGFKPDDLSISQSACYLLLNMADIKTSGMRSVEKEIYNIVSKISFAYRVKGDDFNLSFKIPNLSSLPYVIEKKTIKSLIKEKPNHSNTYSSMYI